MDKHSVFGTRYMAMWAWVRETDPAILAAVVEAPIHEAGAVRLNGFTHDWHKVREAARHILEEGHPAPFFI